MPTFVNLGNSVVLYAFVYVTAGGCGDPGTGVHIFRTLSGTAVGDTVTYACQTGYTLSGSSSRTCQTDGYWSGNLPTCISKYTMAFLYTMTKVAFQQSLYTQMCIGVCLMSRGQ